MQAGSETFVRPVPAPMNFRVCCLGMLTLGVAPLSAQLPPAPAPPSRCLDFRGSREWSGKSLGSLARLDLPALQAAAGPPASAETARPAGAMRKTPALPDEPGQPKRILGLVPNYRTTADPKSYVPLTVRGKFDMARQDSTDRGTFVMAGLFGGEAQLTKATPAYGQGVAGFARYAGAAYVDLAIGDLMTEAVYPTILHQDPRYFRRGTGSVISRIEFAASQIFWTRVDSGAMRFNYSEIIGNATAVAISNAYYPNNRTVSNAIAKLGLQIGVDMAGNILKEFAPELNRAFSRKSHAEAPESQP